MREDNTLEEPGQASKATLLENSIQKEGRLNFFLESVPNRTLFGGGILLPNNFPLDLGVSKRRISSH